MTPAPEHRSMPPPPPPPRIGILIAFTTRGTEITTPHDLLFFKYTLPACLGHRCQSPLTIYLGYDHDDPYFSEERDAALDTLHQQTFQSHPHINHQLHKITIPTRNNPVH